MVEQADNDPAKEDLRDGEFEDPPHEDTEELDRFPRSYNSCKKEVVGGRMPFPNSVRGNMAEGNDNSPPSSEGPSEYRPDSREETPVYPGRSFAVTEERYEINVEWSSVFFFLV